MRLLHAETRKLYIKEGNEIPDYAILSHTWHKNKDEEVLLGDLQDTSRASKKAGFAKIGLCCDQALKDCLEWVWIDTCCIDKTSSTELSEAINSMYRWYQNAKVCYTYLGDVPKHYSHDDLYHSRWFKRAWTLQELLAPTEVVFYSSEWSSIGTKADLKTIISEITGIDNKYLIHGQLQGASVAKRMSWAANREATRSEDIAYSLFGLFDVHMPLIYGEGQLKAFTRLQEEIMRTSNDHTLLAWEISSAASEWPILQDEDDKSGSDYSIAGTYEAPGDARHISYKYGILAESPANFLRSRDLISIPHCRPYNLTNIGLKITLPLSYDFRPRAELYRGTFQLNTVRQMILYAGLSCHPNSDPSQTVTIALQEISPGRFRRYLNRGLVLITHKKISGFVEQKIYIENQHLEDDTSHSYRPLSFIFSGLPPVLEVAEVYPPEFWAPKHEVIQGLTQDDQNRSWCACLLINVKLARRTQFILVLGKNYHDRTWWDNTVDLLLFQTWNPTSVMVGEWCMLLEAQPDKTLQQVHKEIRLPLQRPRRRDICNISNSNHISVDIQGWRYISTLFKTLTVVDITISKGSS